MYNKWIKVFKNGASKVYERQSLKKSFKDCFPQILLVPFLNNWPKRNGILFANKIFFHLIKI